MDEAKKESFYALLEKLYAEIDQPVQQEVKAQLADCFKHRIFTLNNALIALQNPETILESMEAHQKRPTHASEVEKLKRGIVKGSKQFSLPETTPKLSAYRQLCQTAPMFMGWKGDVVGLKLEDRYVPPLDEYWLFVDPRKRVV